jgi:hypothetical protein
MYELSWFLFGFLAFPVALFFLLAWFKVFSTVESEFRKNERM